MSLRVGAVVVPPTLDVVKANERTFFDIYGDWDPLGSDQVRALLKGFRRPWWIIGGRAIEAFTGLVRDHEDTDVAVFTTDFGALRDHLWGEFHLWSNYGGTFRFIDDRHPEPLDPLSQIWVRRDSRSPWLLDIPLNPERGGRWLSKRDDTFDAALEDVTWVADGIRYLNPEIVLHYKATQRRAKDEQDFATSLPLLDARARAWLNRAVTKLDPDHPWLDRLSSP